MKPVQALPFGSFYWPVFPGLDIRSWYPRCWASLSFGINWRASFASTPLVSPSQLKNHHSTGAVCRLGTAFRSIFSEWNGGLSGHIALAWRIVGSDEKEPMGLGFGLPQCGSSV